jgi:hypothetical protein
VINEDGEWEKDVESTLPQEEPDFDQIAEWERQDHEDKEHDGKPCDCPREPMNPEPPGGYQDEPPF